jgi:hypothetical protein
MEGVGNEEKKHGGGNFYLPGDCDVFSAPQKLPTRAGQSRGGDHPAMTQMCEKYKLFLAFSKKNTDITAKKRRKGTFSGG